MNERRKKTVSNDLTSQEIERSINLFCVQTETALSGRHCILKQGHNIFITLSRSIEVEAGLITQGLPSTMQRQKKEEEEEAARCPFKIAIHTLQGVPAFCYDFNRGKVRER